MASGFLLFSMFLRSHFIKGHEYLAVVETFRKEGGVAQRTVLYLGRADRLDRGEVHAMLDRMRVTVRASRRAAREPAKHAAAQVSTTRWAIESLA